MCRLSQANKCKASMNIRSKTAGRGGVGIAVLFDPALGVFPICVYMPVLGVGQNNTLPAICITPSAIVASSKEMSIVSG